MGDARHAAQKAAAEAATAAAAAAAAADISLLNEQKGREVDAHTYETQKAQAMNDRLSNEMEMKLRHACEVSGLENKLAQAAIDLMEEEWAHCLEMQEAGAKHAVELLAAKHALDICERECDKDKICLEVK